MKLEMSRRKFTAQELETLEQAARWFLELLRPVLEWLLKCLEILNDALEEINKWIEDFVMKYS